MTDIIPIDDPDDVRIEPYRDIRERDLVGRQGRFVAEGEVVVEMLLSQSRFTPESVLIDARRLARAGKILAACPPDFPIYAGSRAVIDQLVGFPLHRGLLALGRIGEPLQAGTLLVALPGRALVVAALGIANHDNIGGIFRNAAAFGASAVILDDTCCDPLYRKAIRVSVGASLIVPFARFPAHGLPALLREAGFEPLALSPAGAEELADVAPPERAALLLGTEGKGLDPATLNANRSVRISMARGFDSLNVATACGIALHHLAGGRL